MEYGLGHSGRRRRVHREYVDVFSRMGRDGSIEPVTVMWRDGRAFTVDEVLETGSFGAVLRGRQQARYRVRFGARETFLYLERRLAQPGRPELETLRWWVYAFDVILCAGDKEGMRGD